MKGFGGVRVVAMGRGVLEADAPQPRAVCEREREREREGGRERETHAHSGDGLQTIEPIYSTCSNNFLSGSLVENTQRTFR